VELPVQVTLPEAATDHSALDTLWARARIGRLSELMWYGHGDQSEHIEAITKLGLEHRIVTRWTSLVAVDRSRALQVGSGPKTIRQPVDAPEGVNAVMAGARTTAAVQSVFGGSPGGAMATPETAMDKAEPAAAPMPAAPVTALPSSGQAIGGLGLSGSGHGGGGLGLADSLKKARRVKKAPSRVESTSRARVTGRVRMTATVDAVVRKAVLQKLSAVRRALEQALTRNPSAGGRVVVKLSFDAAGKVLSASLSGSLHDKQLETAVLRIFKRLRLPSRAAGFTVSVPLSLSR